MSRIKNGTYKTINDFADYTIYVNQYLNRLYNNSLKLYVNKYVKNNPTDTPEIDISQISESLEYIDDYLYYYYKYNNLEFFSIFKNLINHLNYITVFPMVKRGLYGQYVDSEKTLYINPQLQKSQTLSADERIRLYICHELGHIQNAKWMEKLVSILNNLNCSNEDSHLMYDGFSLLDEATAQDRAENIAYYYSSKKRPLMFNHSTSLFNRKPFITNFDYYGEFQMPSIDFAKTLRGIGKLDDNNLVMQEFDNRSLDEDFAVKIFDEYASDNQLQNLYYLLKRLGIIKNASYAAFGYAETKYLHQSLTVLEEYNQLVKRLRDYRDPVITNSLK